MGATNEQILTAVNELRDHVKELNGTVKDNCMKIAVLEERVGVSKANWDRIISLAVAVMQALIMWRLFGPATP